MRRVPFAEGEWYHCYSRGIDKRVVFESRVEYERYLQLLYLCNSDKIFHRSDLHKASHAEVLSHPRGNPIVAVGAFSLMPSHPHLVLKEITSGGISKFIGRVNNAYTKYFNLKNGRIGNLLVHPFKAKHVSNDIYFKHLIRYILLNPAELFEPGWKEGRVKDFALLEKQLLAYVYSSIPDYWGKPRLEGAILDQNSMELLKEGLPSLRELLQETQNYFLEQAMSTPGVD